MVQNRPVFSEVGHHNINVGVVVFWEIALLTKLLGSVLTLRGFKGLIQ